MYQEIDHANVSGHSPSRPISELIAAIAAIGLACTQPVLILPAASVFLASCVTRFRLNPAQALILAMILGITLGLCVPAMIIQHPHRVTAPVATSP
jgi:hypothetical protein